MSYTYKKLETALVFKSFSLLVDKIDFARRQLPDQDRSKSQTLDLLYKRADALVVRLRRLGAF